MNFYRRVLTTAILLAVVVTTFAPQWATATQASTEPLTLDAGSAVNAAAPSADLSGPAARPVDSESSARNETLIPMNALILSEADAAATLEFAISEAGGSVYLRQGDALFAGVKGLDDADLAALGARMTYREVVAASDLAAWTAEEQSAITVWNSLVDRQPLNFDEFLASGADARSAVFYDVTGGPQNSALAEPYDPTDTQTSSFLYGDVAVKVVFVESTGAGENWTESEVTKVKAEVAQALDWWSTVSPVPAPGGEGNPTAHVSWDVSYFSQWDNAADYAKTQIAQEPINLTVADAADPDVGWMQSIANSFTGIPGSAGLRTLADSARDDAGTDWGMVLFIVDSSNDADGRFPDFKISGAALNGPWAILTNKGGTLGIDNLEVAIAKMVGHVFGAGDEGWTPEFGGCRPEEVYGYLRVDHTNCEYDLNPRQLVPSLMRSGDVMVSAYSNFQLSEEARGQVGWRDSNGDGTYDVVSTMQNGFAGFASDPICPILRFFDVPILNEPFAPAGYTVADTWGIVVFDPEANLGLGELIGDEPGEDFRDFYAPVNINAPKAVWGRVNAGPWELGYSSDGNWDTKDENYNLAVNGWAGTANNIELIVLDRWENPVLTDPVFVDVAVPPKTGTFEAENRVTPRIDLFDHEGHYETGWSSAANPLASGGSYMASGSEAGHEACFTFDGRMARIQYIPDPSFDTQKAQVYVDGELHSFIFYDGANTAPMNHLIANLSDDFHTVQVMAEIGPITMDNFNIWEITPADVIHGTQPGGAYSPDVGAGTAFFYENTGGKYFPNGTWTTVPLPASSRPGVPDNSAKSSDQPYNRLYMFVDQANIAAIYREVGPGMGTASVYVDGEFRGVMNNEAAFSDVLPFYIGGLDPSPVSPDPWYHAIEIKVNEGSVGVNVDAVRLLYAENSGLDFMSAALGGTSDILYNDPMVTQEEYGVWSAQTAGQLYQSRDMGSVLNIFFEGSAIAALVKTNNLSGGAFEMYVDGKLIRTVDLKTAGANDAPIIAHGFDADLPHVLQIRHINLNPVRLRFSQYRGFRVYNILPVTPADCGIDTGPDKGGCEEYSYDGNGDPTTSVFLYEQLWRFVKFTTGEVPSDQRLIESRHRDSRAYVYVTGADTATLYGVSGLTYGTVEVLVNGDLFGTWNLRRAARAVDHPYTITGLNPTKTSLIELRMENGRGTMGIDRLVLYNRPTLVPNSMLPLGDPNEEKYENDSTIDGVPALQFSGQWRRIEDVNSSGGNHELSAGAGDRVEFDVEGASSVVLYRSLRSAYGFADVYVNGELYGTFDNKLFSPTGVYQQPFAIAGLNPYFKNRIRIEGKMVRNWTGNLTARPFDIDFVIVRQPEDETAGSTYLEPGYYDDSDAQAIAGGAITYIGDRWQSEGTVHKATNRGHKAQIIFEGDALSIYIDKVGLGGRVELYVDGQLKGTMSPGGNTEDVPFTVVGLDYGVHVAELLHVRGVLQIDAYQVYDLTPHIAPTYDLTNPAEQATFNTPGYVLSEEWAVNGAGFLETSEGDASLFAYLVGGDTLFLSHIVGEASADIEIYVNGELTGLLAGSSMRQQKPGPDGVSAEYMLGGLMFMQDTGTWIEIRKKGAGKIQIKSMRVGNVADLGTLDVGTKVEAEWFEDDPPPSGFYLIGPWFKQPFKSNANYSGGFDMQSNSQSSKALIVVDGAEYLTIYRTMKLAYNDAAIFVDGEYWGNMPNKSTKTQYQVPFTVGPFDTETTHAVELRQTGTQKYAIDYVETTESLPGPIGAGFYENTDEVFADAFVGNWTEAANANASGGTQQRGSGTGSRMTFTFTGNKITLYRQMWGLGGVTYVYIDGSPYSIFNRFAKTTYQVPYTIVLPTSGLHQFELVVGTQVTWVDAIEIGNLGPATFGAYQHDAPQVIVNSDIQWTVQADPNHSGGSYIETKERYANMFMLFYGESVQIYSTQGRQWGMYSVFLDGEFIEEVDLYENLAVDSPFFKYELTGLEKQNHVLELRFERHKNPRAGGTPRANFDVLTVDGANPPLPGEDDDPGTSIPRVGCFEESDSKWVLYGAGDAWQYIEDPAASGDLYLEGQAFPNVAAEFMFQSAGFTLLYHTEGGAGKAIIEVDGTVVDIVDMSNVGFDSLDVTNLDPNKLHVLRIKQGGGGPIFIDRIDLPSYNPSYDDNCRIQ